MASPQSIFTRNASVWPGLGSRWAVAIERGGSMPTSVRFQPLIPASSRPGTLMLSTTGLSGRPVTSPSTAAAATVAALCQG